MPLIWSLLAGAGLGAALGYFGKCASGTCPLTANWQRGAAFGAVLGLMFYLVSARNGTGNLGEPTPNVRLVNEQQFATEVAASQQPAVVDFFATWCGPCKALSPMLNDLAGPLTNRVTFLKVDIDQSSKLAERFGIEGVPTVLFFRDGKEVDRLVGLPAREALKQQLESFASTASTSAAAKR